MISSFLSAALFIGDEEKKVIAPQNGKQSTANFGAIAPRLHIIGEYASFVNMAQSSTFTLDTNGFFLQQIHRKWYTVATSWSMKNKKQCEHMGDIPCIFLPSRISSTLLHPKFLLHVSLLVWV